ncbi:MAG: GNAT family N-acetyltransferase [Planctomycetota bacterium]|jgi:hypothetical protein
MKRELRTNHLDGWEVDIIRSFEGIESIRSVWKEMRCSQSTPFPNPNSDIDGYLSILEPIKDTTEPYIILLRRHGCPEAMLIGRKANIRIECKFGYLTLLKPSLQSILIPYGGILGNMNSDVCSVMIEELNHSLRNDEADVAVFNHLSTDSEVYRVARTKPNVLSRGHFPKVEPHRSMSIPDDIELFYKRLSKKHRGNLRRYMRNLEKEHQVRIMTYCTEDMLADGIKAAAKVSSWTYQQALGSGFVDDAPTRSRLAAAARQGLLRLHVLFINDDPCAFQLGVQYRRTYFLGQMGFVPQWKQLCIGTTLFLKVLESLCRDPEVDSLDFGFGDAEYKRSYGNEHWLEATVYMFAPRFYPIWINSLQSSMRAVSLGMSALARTIRFEQWVKSRWRNSLQQSYAKSKT